MPLAKDADIRKAAHSAEPELREVVERERELNDDNMRVAFRKANARDPSIPVLRSTRSLRMVAVEYIENVH